MWELLQDNIVLTGIEKVGSIVTLGDFDVRNMTPNVTQSSRKS